MATPTIKLNSGHAMPLVGFGLWKVEPADAADIVYNAIKAGYRLLDGACDYGNEVECGRGVARAIAEGIVRREDLFITSKIWPTFHEPERVEPICRRQLADWGDIGYFDLYMIHFPVALAYVDPAVRYPPTWKYDGKSEIRTGHTPIRDTWAAMEAVAAAGLARSIGVCNFQAQLLYDLLRGSPRLPPAALQIEHHPYLAQPRLVRLAQAAGIAVTAYSSLGPTSFVGLESNFEKQGFQFARDLPPLLEDATVREVAAKVGKTPAQVLLRWATQRGIAVIPKTRRATVMPVNLDCTGWDIPQDDMDKISGMDRGLRFNEPTNYFETDKLWIFG